MRTLNQFFKLLSITMLGVSFLMCTSALAGFDWGGSSCSGNGSFQQAISKNDVVVIGDIPAGKQGIRIELTCDQDVDIQLFDKQNGTKIVQWPDGLLSGAGIASTVYGDVTVEYSGYNGTGGNLGHEYIEITGTMDRAFTMKAFGYAAGDALVEYSWTGTEGCTEGPAESGSGTFQQDITKDDVVVVGELPQGLKNISIELISDQDVDIQLYDEANNQAIVQWPNGILNGASTATTDYGDVTIEYSGYNGDGTGKGHEYIKITGTLDRPLVMKAFGYASGYATINYSWGTETNQASDFEVTSHYYDKGRFDRYYDDYETAFSDNHTDLDVEIHSYIVINFNADVNPAMLSNNSITVKRLEMTDNQENNDNIINGSFELISARQAVFKPTVEYYSNPNGTFDWNNPNWNGLKPNYTYSVALASSIKDTAGNALGNENGNQSWEFQTIDIDYGLYWFKNSSRAVKYVPGRDLPLDYYNPSKPNFVYSHGWEKTSVNFQSGKLRDYRREGFYHDPSMYYSGQGGVDLVEIWKNPAKNYEHRSWNFGAVYWNQLADDDYANLSKPQKAEAKMWSTNGKGGMEYAIRKKSGSSWTTSNTLVTTNAPVKPMSVIFAEIIISALQDTSNSDLRFMGHSLGNQMVTGISYVLKEEYAAGRISAKLFPKRVALVDPYFRPGRLENSWTNDHPAAANLGSSSDSPGQMCVKIMEDIIAYADNDSRVSFALTFYDTSGTCDKDVLFGNRLGDPNNAERDIAAISYLQSSWLPGSELDNNYLAQRHVNGRLWYLWQYAFAPPATGFSCSSTDSAIKAKMNYYKTSKIRYSITTGIGTPTPGDDNYSEKSGSWQK